MAGYEGNGGGGGGRTESFAMTEQQYVPAKVSVWWDIENCQVPRSCEPHLIAKNISSALVTMNYCGPVSINAYGDTTKISSSTQQALNSTGISLNHVPAGAKDASDKKILVDMLFWAVDNPAPANYLLISGDRDFSNALHQLQMRRYNILLAQPKQPSIHLIAAAKNVWLWSNLVTGGPPFTSTELSQFINTRGVSSTSTPGTGSTQISQSGDSLPPVNQRSTNMKNEGGSFIQPTISSTQTAVLGSQGDFNNGNPHNLGYGLTNNTNDGQNFSCNPNSTVPIPGSSPFFHTYHPDAFSNNGSNHPGYLENPYNMSVRPQTFPMHPPPPPPPPPNFLPPLSHAHSIPTVSHRPNTFPFTVDPHVHNGPNTASPNNQSPINGPNTAVPNNPSPFDGLLRSHTLPSTAGSSIQLPSTWPSNGYSVPNASAYDNQLQSYGIQKGFSGPNSAGSDNKSTINKPQKGKSVPKTTGSGSQPTVNKPQKGKSMPKTTGSDSRSTVNKPQKGKSVPKSTGSDSQSTVNKPQKGKIVPKSAGSNNELPVSDIAGSDKKLAVNKLQECANVPSNGLLVSSVCPVPNELAHGLTRVVLLALETLKNEKIMPTEENIANCIKYGDPKHRETNLKKALKKAVYQQELVVKQYVGASQFYVAKDDKLWKCVNLVSGNVKDYSESVWGEVEKFLSSDSGRNAILATECRYEAATIMKKECLKELPLGKILQFLNMVIDYKKWIVPHESGWQPLEITFTGTSPVLVVASSDAHSN